MNLKHLSTSYLDQSYGKNKPKIGNTHKSIRYRNQLKGSYKSMRQKLEDDMSHKQNCEAHICSQKINTIEQAYLAH